LDLVEDLGVVVEHQVQEPLDNQEQIVYTVLRTTEMLVVEQDLSALHIVLAAVVVLEDQVKLLQVLARVVTVVMVDPLFSLMDLLNL
tara:strand:- start:263 stop:523 length:261 start_codon:yes stop_codon:yes gene_type:complete